MAAAGENGNIFVTTSRTGWMLPKRPPYDLSLIHI